MKIRTDFVSNSSSSSFIIAGDSASVITKYNLTKQDFIDAIKDLGGNYEEILDKEIPEDFDKMQSEYTDWLKSWYTPYIVRHVNYDGTEDIEYIPPTNSIRERKTVSDDFSRPGYHFEKWVKFYETIHETRLGNDLPYNDWTPEITEVSHYDFKQNKCTFEKIDPSLYEILTDVYKNCGIVSNHDALMIDFSRFLIHFADNEVHFIKGMTDACKNDHLVEVENDYDRKYNEEIKTSIWETEPYSMFRFCEILVKWFKDKGKIPSDSDVTWRDLADSMTACCMHEG